MSAAVATWARSFNVAATGNLRLKSRYRFAWSLGNEGEHLWPFVVIAGSVHDRRCAPSTMEERG